MRRLIVDTCIWYALLDKADDKHNYADEIERVLQSHQIIIPFPVLYETLNTRFVKNNYQQCQRIFDFINNPAKVTIIPDDRYREKALQIINQNSSKKQQHALVDLVIRLMMEDVNLGPLAVYNFNVDDFSGVGNTEVISPQLVL